VCDLNLALIRKEYDDIFSEKLYIFAFFAQLVIVFGVLFAALLYTSIAAPETSTFVQTQRPRIGIIGSDADITAQLDENIEVISVSGEPFEVMASQNLVAVLFIKSESDFEVYLDNTEILSGYAETLISETLLRRSNDLKRTILEEKMETAEIILNPININEERVGEKITERPPEFIVIMYGLLVPFILLLPTFLATNMVTDSIVGEKERKTYEVLASAPVTRWGIILSKVLPIISIALLQSFIWILLLRFKDIPIYNIGLLMLLLLVLDIIFIGFGVLISAFSDTLKESNLTVTIAILLASIAMFAPLPIKAGIQGHNPITLMTKLASNPQVPLSDLTSILLWSIIALLILFGGEYMLKKRETLRL
jgi:ABC-2 type transport system permease protein